MSPDECAPGAGDGGSCNARVESLNQQATGRYGAARWAFRWGIGFIYDDNLTHIVDRAEDVIVTAGFDLIVPLRSAIFWIEALAVGPVPSQRLGATLACLLRVSQAARYSDSREAELDLHCPTAIGREGKGPVGVGERDHFGQQRAHVDLASCDEVHRPAELLVEAEAAAQLQLLGDDGIHRQGDVAAEAELHDRAAGMDQIKSAAQRAVIARALQQHVEISLVRLVRGNVVRT